jgi:DNA replication protein DnaC
MTQIKQLWTQLKFISDPSSLTEEQLNIIYPILKEEVSAREAKRMRYLLQRSGIKRIKRIEDFDWKFNVMLPREKIMAFSGISWNIDVQNLVMIGPSGIGKTHISSAFCYQAIQKGIPAAFITCFDLVNKLKNAADKLSMINYYSTINLLCIDELGYVFPTPEQANDIFQIISKRSELVSTIVTSNLIPSLWGKIFEPSTATAILDRLNYNGVFIVCEGDSYRPKKNNKKKL